MQDKAIRHFGRIASQLTRNAGHFSCFFRYGTSYGFSHNEKEKCRNRKIKKPVNPLNWSICRLFIITAHLRHLIRHLSAVSTLFSCYITLFSCQQEQNIHLLQSIQKAGLFFGIVMRIFSNSPISKPSISPYCLKSCIMACAAGLQDFHQPGTQLLRKSPTNSQQETHIPKWRRSGPHCGSAVTDMGLGPYPFILHRRSCPWIRPFPCNIVSPRKVSYDIACCHTQSDTVRGCFLGLSGFLLGIRRSRCSLPLHLQMAGRIRQ